MFPCRIVAEHIARVLFLEIGNGAEPHAIPELLAVGPVAAFDLAVLRGLPRIDEVMDEIVPCARDIERMKSWRQRVGAFPVARIVIREDASVVGLNAKDFEWRFEKELLKEDDRRPVGVFARHPGITPPRCATQATVVKENTGLTSGDPPQGLAGKKWTAEHSTQAATIYIALARNNERREAATNKRRIFPLVV